MVTRNYQAPQFNVQEDRTLREASVSGTDTRVMTPNSVGDSQWKDRLLGSLAQNGQQTLNKMADIEYSNLYLEGQAQAGIVQSEEELQGNPLTRDWKVAGYRDTMGKLALADHEAKFQADIQQLRQQGPEEVQSYLSKRREDFLPQLAGMSRDARATAAGQMLLQDRAATKKWTTEHTKFIIEQKTQAIQTQWGTSLNGLKDAQLRVATGEMGEDEYKAQLQSATGTVIGSVLMDMSLPGDVRKNIVFEAIQQAQANDIPTLYDYLKDNQMPDGKGGAASPLTLLDGEQQIKLANGQRDTMQRTRDQRDMQRITELAGIESQIDNKLYQGDEATLMGKLRPMVLNKTISAERMGTVMNKFYDQKYKQDISVGLAGAYQKGDVQAITRMGKSEDDAVSAMSDNMNRQGLAPEQRLTAWLNAGTNGFQSGFKEAGKQLGVTLRQMVNSKDGTVLPQHVATFRAINAAMNQAEANGLTNTRVNLLSGLGEDDRMFAEQIFRRVGQGAALEEAVQTAKDIQAKDGALTASTRAARSAAQSQGITAAVDALEPRGLIATGWDHLKALVSPTAQQDLILRPSNIPGDKNGWFSTGPTVQFRTEQVRNELRQEANDVALLRPSSDAESIMNVARANLAARTVSTKDGPLVMPRGVNLQQVFGIAPGNQAAIGKAIDGLTKSTKDGSSWQTSFAQGQLWAQEFDKDGNRVGTGHFINAEQIKAKIKEDMGVQQEEARATYGPGKKVEVQTEGGGKAQVQYSGSNSAGVPNSWMLEYRDNLVQHEGVRSKPYQDLSGKIGKDGKPIQTVGVGVSSHNPNYPKVQPDGTITQADLNISFLGASDEAARKGADLARRVGVDNKAGFQLMSELAYQSGGGFLQQDNNTGKQYQEFARALRSGDVTQAQEAFKSTAAWRFSGKGNDMTPRQRSYMKLIEQAMKG